MSASDQDRGDRAEGEAPGWRRILPLARAEDSSALVAFIASLSDLDRVHAFGRLSPEERSLVLSRLSPQDAALILEALPATHAVEAFEELAPDAAADILAELASDDQADLIGRLDESSAEAILSETSDDTAAAVRDLLQYPPDTAGGRMITEYVSVPETSCASDVVAQMQSNADQYADYIAQYVYVVGPRGQLEGVLPLRVLLLARPERSVASLMIREPVRVLASTRLDELFEVFDSNAFLAVPVVDESSVLVGVLLREDVDEARLSRADDQALKARGIVGGEELRSLPLHVRSRRRLAWLSTNIVLNTMTASVIAMYEDTLQAVIALAVFLPIISDMSGCSGNQAVAVSLRELSLGVTRPSEVGRVLLKESSLGIVNGIVLGLLLGGLAWLWKGSLVLGAVVGGALAVNTVVAVCIGGSVPLLVRRLGFDPALASSPMLTTTTDLCGFLLVLSLATFALSRAML
jgi:magnesium transporter